MDPSPLGRDPLPTPDDYRAFWDAALDEATRHPLDVRRAPVEAGLTTIDVFDVSFSGHAGRRVGAWLRLPRNRDGALAVVVHANGYGAGRLDAIDDLTWASAGYAHLTVNIHDQGGASSGHLVEGIIEPERSYYRGVFVDCVRAVQVARELTEADPDRVAMIGNSQGGGIALGIGALVPGLRAILAQAPFLTDAPEALGLATAGPWLELRDYLAENPSHADRVARTLSYVDGVTSARHATAPGWLSSGLADPICPPATIRAATDAYAAEVSLTEWPGAGHEAGATADRRAALHVLRDVFTKPPNEEKP